MSKKKKKKQGTNINIISEVARIGDEKLPDEKTLLNFFKLHASRHPFPDIHNLWIDFSRLNDFNDEDNDHVLENRIIFIKCFRLISSQTVNVTALNRFVSFVKEFLHFALREIAFNLFRNVFIFSLEFCRMYPAIRLMYTISDISIKL